MLVEVRHVPAVFNSACLHHLVHLLTLIHWCNSSLKQDVALLVVPSLVLKLAVHTNHFFCVACSACLCSLLTLKSQVQGQAHLFASLLLFHLLPWYFSHGILFSFAILHSWKSGIRSPIFPLSSSQTLPAPFSLYDSLCHKTMTA